MTESFTIGGVEVGAGERREIEIPVARLFTSDWLSLPVMVIRGKTPGPTLWLDAAIHGDELNGMEIIQRVLKYLGTVEIHGTVIAVPIVNVFGFVQEIRYLPDRRDLNRSFPGSTRGSLTARLAHLFLNEIVRKSDFGIDLHTGSLHRTNLAQVRANLDNQEVRRLAEAFEAPLMFNARNPPGSLRGAAGRLGIPMIVFEGGEPMRFNREVIEEGVDGIKRVMHRCGILPDSPLVAQADRTFEAQGSRWIRAGRSGIFRQQVELGERVAKGQVLGTVGSHFPGASRPVRATTGGMIIGHTNKPLVHQGDALVHIGIGLAETGNDDQP